MTTLTVQDDEFGTIAVRVNSRAKRLRKNNGTYSVAADHTKVIPTAELASKMALTRPWIPDKH